MKFLKAPGIIFLTLTALSNSDFSAASASQDEYNTENWTGTFTSTPLIFVHTPEGMKITLLNGGLNMSIGQSFTAGSKSCLMGWTPSSEITLKTSMSAMEFYKTLSAAAKVDNIEPSTLREHLLKAQSATVTAPAKK
jgi:hypothetical protein